MKYAVSVFWLCFSLVLLSLANCSSDDSGQPDAQSDAKTDSTLKDGAADASDAKADVVSSFNVTQATAISATRITVTFDAPPDPAQAIVASNYNVPTLGLTAPSLTGNTVTLTTTTQTAQKYTITVTGVTRQSDAAALTKASADFNGRDPFDVASAASVDSATMTVTYDAPPNATQATTLANYTVNGLTLSGTPVLAGNTVTITTSGQGSQSYQVDVANVARASDGEPLLVNHATFNGTPTFNVASALATGNTQMTVTFDAPPDPTSAVVLGNYAVQGLVLKGTPQLSGSTVTITTAAQVAQQYTVVVTNVKRASDSAPLATNQANFQGRTSFNVLSAAAASTSTITVTFDAPPDAATATTLANYNVPGLTLTGKVSLSGSTVTLNSNAQTAIQFTVTVSNVIRASDSEPLTNTSATFTGRTPFDVSSASSTNAVTITVTFDAPPNAAQATTLSNYAVQNLTLSGTPVLNGNTVTILTSPQTATAYSVSVINVTRGGDGEPLTTKDAAFTGTAVQAPTVTNVAVTATSPNNGTNPYNTGTVTTKITGTDFTSVVCPTGVKLDDLNGVGAPVGTKPTSCTVDSDTQITATWPAGIRTNGSTGWNVLVTNSVGSNTTSSVTFVSLAGLLVSEVVLATTASANNEFIEIYNPTGTSIDTTSTGIGLNLHQRTSSGSDQNKTLTKISSGVIPSHGFLLFVSSASLNESWFSSRDYTYPSAFGADGGVYISLSTTKDVKVIDKVGWGAQPTGGFEGTVVTNNMGVGNSIQRKPAGGQGDATDTDDNSADFNAASTSITPKGTADAVEP